MEALPTLLAALLALCVMPSALALKCQECANVPGYGSVQPCDSENAGTIKCGAFMDKCITLKGTITVPGSVSLNIEMKNCTSSILCDSTSDFNMCKLLNMSGLMSACSADCCEGELCNGSGAVRISGLVASFGAILVALILNLFPGY